MVLSLQRRGGFFLLGVSPHRAQGFLMGGCQGPPHDLPIQNRASSAGAALTLGQGDCGG